MICIGPRNPSKSVACVHVVSDNACICGTVTMSFSLVVRMSSQDKSCPTLSRVTPKSQVATRKCEKTALIPSGIEFIPCGLRRQSEMALREKTAQLRRFLRGGLLRGLHQIRSLLPQCDERVVVPTWQRDAVLEHGHPRTTPGQKNVYFYILGNLARGPPNQSRKSSTFGPIKWKEVSVGRNAATRTQTLT